MLEELGACGLCALGAKLPVDGGDAIRQSTLHEARKCFGLPFAEC
jgi:hypothetical protein